MTPLDDDYIQRGCVIGGASSCPDTGDRHKLGSHKFSVGKLHEF